jgi:hypothetical protein
MTTYKDLFTPIFIVIALSLFIGGIVVLQVLDKLFHGSKNLPMIRIFCICVILNIIIIVFLIMSFSRVKLQTGPQGPTGNKGQQGYEGKTGGLQICSKKFQTIEEKKTLLKNQDYLDVRPPLIKND